MSRLGAGRTIRLELDAAMVRVDQARRQAANQGKGKTRDPADHAKFKAVRGETGEK